LKEKDCRLITSKKAFNVLKSLSGYQKTQSKVMEKMKSNAAIDCNLLQRCHETRRLMNIVDANKN